MKMKQIYCNLLNRITIWVFTKTSRYTASLFIIFLICVCVCSSLDSYPAELCQIEFRATELCHTEVFTVIRCFHSSLRKCTQKLNVYIKYLVFLVTHLMILHYYIEKSVLLLSRSIYLFTFYISNLI